MITREAWHKESNAFLLRKIERLEEEITQQSKKGSPVDPQDVEWVLRMRDRLGLGFDSAEIPKWYLIEYRVRREFERDRDRFRAQYSALEGRAEEIRMRAPPSYYKGQIFGSLHRLREEIKTFEELFEGMERKVPPLPEVDRYRYRVIPAHFEYLERAMDSLWMP